MPQSVSGLVELLDLEAIEDNLFRGRQPETRRQRVFGGQVAAQALVAAARTVDPERHLHGMHAYFLRGGDTAVPIIYDVERMRDGHSFSTRRVVARQHGRPIFYLTASLQRDEPGLEHEDTMPQVPEPEQCRGMAEVVAEASGIPDEGWTSEWAALDVRYIDDSRPEGGGLDRSEHPARCRLWMRIAGDLPEGRVLHNSMLAYASDLTLLSAALVPHGIFITSPRLQAASLDHAMWFHRPFRADEWLLYDQIAPSASGGRGLGTGRVFNRAGHLVATVAQEGLIRPVRGG